MKFKFLTWAMLLGMLSFGVTACSDDDDEPVNKEQSNNPKDDDEKGEDEKGDDEKEEVKDTLIAASYLGQMNVEFNGESYLSDSINIVSSYDSLGNLSLDFIGVKFVPQMPVTLDITVPSIPCAKSEEGTWQFKADTVVPTMMTRPMPAYTATDLQGEIKGDSIAFTLKFGDYPTSYKGQIVK